MTQCKTTRHQYHSRAITLLHKLKISTWKVTGTLILKAKLLCLKRSIQTGRLISQNPTARPFNKIQMAIFKLTTKHGRHITGLNED